MNDQFSWLAESQGWLAVELADAIQRVFNAKEPPRGVPYVCSRAFDILVDPDRVRLPVGQRPFRRDSADSILAALRDGSPLPPVEVVELDSGTGGGRFQWHALDGFHRLHLARVMGVDRVPVVVMETFIDPSVPGMALTRKKCTD